MASKTEQDAPESQTIPQQEDSTAAAHDYAANERRLSLKSKLSDLKQTDPELVAALADSRVKEIEVSAKAKLETAKEANRHTEAMANNENKNPTKKRSYIAAVTAKYTVASGIAGFLILTLYGFPEEAKLMLAFGGSALTYLFGVGSRDD